MIAADRLTGQRAFRARLGEQAAASARRMRKIYAPALEALSRKARTLRNGDFADRDVQIFRDDVQARLDALLPSIEAEVRDNEREGLREGAILAAERLRQWTPDIPELPEGAGYVDSAAWQDQSRKFGPFHAAALAALIATAKEKQRDKFAIGQAVIDYLDKRPYFDMVRNGRTVQLWSARAGQREIFRANRRIVRAWIWSCARDKRTCMSCWAMDGTRHDIEEILNDHHLGRCAMVPVTPDWSDFGMGDGGQGAYGGGEGAFRRLSEDEQISAMGLARWRAWQDGLFRFSDLSMVYVDPVFGPMRRETPLERLIGANLAQSYARRG